MYDEVCRRAAVLRVGILCPMQNSKDRGGGNGGDLRLSLTTAAANPVHHTFH